MNGVCSLNPKNGVNEQKKGISIHVLLLKRVIGSAYAGTKKPLLCIYNHLKISLILSMWFIRSKKSH
jgi:hypothetical protein